MKIEKYELYHIGTKLKNVDLKSLKRTLQEKMVALEYEMPVEKSTSSGSIISIGVDSGVDVIGHKNEVNVEINYVSNALNVNGNNPVNIYNCFIELIDIIGGLPEYELEAIVEFYEVLSKIMVSNKEVSPNDTLKNSTNVNLDALNVFGEVGVTGLALKAKNSMADDEIFEMVLGAHPTSPSKFLISKIVRRTKDKESLKDFEKVIEKSIKELIE